MNYFLNFNKKEKPSQLRNGLVLKRVQYKLEYIM